MFSCWNCAFCIILRVSLGLLFHLDNQERNRINILITNTVRNSDQHGFKLNKLFLVFLSYRIICTSELKHLIVSMVGFEIWKIGLLIDYPADFIKNHSLQICLLVQFCSVLQVTSSGAEFSFHVEFCCTTKNLKNHPLVIW